MTYTLYEIRRLERRVAMLERAAGIEPNLYSTNLAEVISAVENGEDVNQTNSNNMTPLEFAVKNCNGDTGIVDYLLEHGANPDALLKTSRMPLVAFALGKKMFNVAISLAKKSEVLATLKFKDHTLFYGCANLGLTDASLCEFISTRGALGVEDYLNKVVIDASNLYRTSKITKEIYKLVLNKVKSELAITGSSSFSRLNSSLFSAESKNELSFKNITDSPLMEMLAKEGCLALGRAANAIKSPLYSKTALEYIYNWAIISLDNGYNVSAKDYSDLVSFFGYAIQNFGASADELDSLVTVEMLKSLDRADKDAEYENVLLGAVKFDLTSILKKCVAADISVTDGSSAGNSTLIYIADNSVSRSATRLACRAILKKNHEFDDYTLRKIASSTNETLIRYLVEYGFGFALAQQWLYCKNADVAKNILSEYDYLVANSRGELIPSNGIAVDPEVVKSDTNSKKKNQQNIAIVIHAIEENIPAGVERIIRADPSILNNQNVLAALSDSRYANSSTVRQIKRLQQELSSNIDDSYDM